MSPKPQPYKYKRKRTKDSMNCSSNRSLMSLKLRPYKFKTRRRLTKFSVKQVRQTPQRCKKEPFKAKLKRNRALLPSSNCRPKTCLMIFECKCCIIMLCLSDASPAAINCPLSTVNLLRIVADQEHNKFTNVFSRAELA